MACSASLSSAGSLRSWFFFFFFFFFFFCFVRPFFFSHSNESRRCPRPPSRHARVVPRQTLWRLRGLAAKLWHFRRRQPMGRWDEEADFVGLSLWPSSASCPVGLPEATLNDYAALRAALRARLFPLNESACIGQSSAPVVVNGVSLWAPLLMTFSFSLPERIPTPTPMARRSSNKLPWTHLSMLSTTVFAGGSVRGSPPTSRKPSAEHSPWSAWINRNSRATPASRRVLFLPRFPSQPSTLPVKSWRPASHRIRSTASVPCLLALRKPRTGWSPSWTAWVMFSHQYVHLVRHPSVSSSCVLRLWHARPRSNGVSPPASSPVDLFVHPFPVVVFKLASVGAGDLPPTVSSCSNNVKEMVEGVLASAQSLAAHARLLLTSSCVPSLEPRPSSVPDLPPSRVGARAEAIGNPGDHVKVADYTDSPVLFPFSPSRVTDMNGSGDGATTPLSNIVDTCPGYFVAGECAPCPADTPLIGVVDTPRPGYFVAGECVPYPAATQQIDIVDTSCRDSTVAGNCTPRPSRDLPDITTSLPPRDIVLAPPAADVVIRPAQDPPDAASRPVCQQPLPFRHRDHMYVLEDIPAAPDWHSALPVFFFELEDKFFVRREPCKEFIHHTLLLTHICMHIDTSPHTLHGIHAHTHMHISW